MNNKPGRPKIYTDDELIMRVREKDRIRKKEQREEWKQAGLCISCGKPRDTHRLKCSSCYQASLKHENKKRHDRFNQGLCVECGKAPASGGYVICDKCLIKQRNRFRNNKVKRNKIAKDWRVRVRNDVFTAYGNKCACCGETESLFLEIDHISGGGTQHRKLVPGGTAFYRWLQKQGYPQDDYQLLCRNCNYGRFRNGGICPHKDIAKN